MSSGEIISKDELALMRQVNLRYGKKPKTVGSILPDLEDTEIKRSRKEVVFPPYLCKVQNNGNKCRFYNEVLNICMDKEFFIDKNNKKLILCRYSENAAPFGEIYK